MTVVHNITKNADPAMIKPKIAFIFVIASDIHVVHSRARILNSLKNQELSKIKVDDLTRISITNLEPDTSKGDIFTGKKMLFMYFVGSFGKNNSLLVSS